MPRLDILLLELLVIILLAQALGWMFRALGQPRVLGEIVAGILLGPSLLGWIAPAVAAKLFPVGNMGALYALSQLGLILFMFHVGLEVDPVAIRKVRRTAIIVSNTSMIVPFILGAALAIWVLPSLAPSSMSRLGYVLFTGVAMSITAFPVLARILVEKGLTKTRIGAVAIACAVVDDVSAWCVLAIILTIVRSHPGAPLAMNFIGLALYAFGMMAIVRPLTSRLLQSSGIASKFRLPVAMIVLLVSAFVTEWIGVHALFGAFMAGLVMPHDESVRKDLSATFAPLSTTLLLPIFFAYTGLRTSFGVVHGSRMWLYFVAILLVAIVGKLASSTVAARLSGLEWRESAALGVLLNTRGLVELVILNIGYDLGVISKEMFSLMVMMALVTTLMTSPLLSWIYPSSEWKNRAAVG